MKQADRVERINEYLKNVWKVRKFFIKKYGVDPSVINGDQMPLHRNDSAQQKTLNSRYFRKGKLPFVPGKSDGFHSGM